MHRVALASAVMRAPLTPLCPLPNIAIFPNIGQPCAPRLCPRTGCPKFKLQPVANQWHPAPEIPVNLIPAPADTTP